jgi:cysteine desulfurase / selenocysteine lyase
MDLDQIRRDTPHCQDKLFFNSAGSSLSPQPVLDKMLDYLQAEAEVGGYHLAEQHQAEIADFYTQVATLIGASASNIAFAPSATEAYLKALSSIAFQPGDLIVTSDDDYVSNQLHFLSLQKRFGLRLERIKTLPNGDLDLDDFARLTATQAPKLVAITHVPTNSGLVQNVEAIGEVCAANGWLFLVDACQSVGQLAVDVRQLKCDFLAATGRKFLRGPRGTGFLYVSDRVLDRGDAPLFIDHRGAAWTSANRYQLVPTAQRFETWEVPYALLVGLKEAVKYANQLGLPAIETYNAQLTRQLRDRLAGLPGVTLYDQGTRTCSIVTWRKAGKSAEQLKERLASHRLFCGISPPDAGVIDFGKKGVDWVVRLSPHYFNTSAEVEATAEIIDQL